MLYHFLEVLKFAVIASCDINTYLWIITHDRLKLLREVDVPVLIQGQQQW
jgi:hypothetical protein